MTVMTQVKLIDGARQHFTLNDNDWRPWINVSADDDLFKKLVLNQFLRMAGYQAANSFVHEPFHVTVFTRDLGQPNDVDMTIFEVSPREKP